MNLHPELAALTARYDELVDAVERGQLDAGSAMSTLEAMVAVDATGAEWRLDASGTWLRSMPGSQPYPADPQAFVTTAGYSDNGWTTRGGTGAPGSPQAPSHDPYAMPPVLNNGQPQSYGGFQDPFSHQSGLEYTADGFTDTRYGADEHHSAPREQGPKRASGLQSLVALMPRIPSLPHISLPKGRNRTILVVVLCLIITGGLFTRSQNSSKVVIEQSPSVAESTSSTTTSDPVDGTGTSVVEETPVEAGTGTAATDTSPVVPPARPIAASGKLTLKQAQAVIDALTGRPSARATVTGAVGRDLVDVAAELSGARELGFKLRVTKITVAGDSAAEITVSALSTTSKPIATWGIRLVVARGNWVVGGYPDQL